MASSEGVHLLSIESQVAGEFGDIRALFGEQPQWGHDPPLRWPVAAHRWHLLRTDVVKESEGSTKCEGVVVRVQHLHSAPHISRDGPTPVHQ